VSNSAHLFLLRTIMMMKSDATPPIPAPATNVNVGSTLPTVWFVVVLVVTEVVVVVGVVVVLVVVVVGGSSASSTVMLIVAEQ